MGNDHGGHGCLSGAEEGNGLLDQAQVEHGVIEQALQRIVHPAPHQIHHKGRHDPGQEQEGAEKVAATDVLVRLQQDNDPRLGDKIIEVLHQDGSAVEKRRVDYVGPQVGEDLRDQGGIAMLVSLFKDQSLMNCVVPAQ